jgi:hypothetical protein
MRFGLAVSAIGHALILLVGVIALTSPRQIDRRTPPSVTVDIIPENEIAAAKDRKLDVSSEVAAGDPIRQTATAPARHDVPEQIQDAAADSRPAAATPTGPQQETPDKQPDRVAAASPPVGQSPQPDPFKSNAPPLYVPLLQGIDGVRDDFDFDTHAYAAAKLTAEEISAFRTQLQKCWKAPAGMAEAQNLRAVLRVALSPRGTLTKQPLLIEASASTYGPKLVETATRALRQCQPFTFLPAEKYQEWQLLDLSFSPRGLAGG